MSNIGNNIKARRTALKMTQEELAAKMGYKSKSTINKIELGINDIPQSKIVKFAEVLQTTPKALMGWEEVTEEMQKKSDIKEYAEKHGLKIVEWYMDEGVSGRKRIRNRPELQRMIRDAEAGKFDRIIFIKLDRFFRSVAEYHECMKRIGPVIWTATEEKYDLSTANGRAFVNMKLTICELEADQTGERIDIVNEYKVKTGQPLSGSMKFCWTIVQVGERKRIIKNPETADIMEDLLHHIWTHQSKAATLKYTNSKYDMDMSYDSLSKLLKNTWLYGEYRGNPNYLAEQDRYMTKEDYLKMQEFISRQVKDNAPVRDYIFSGLIKCPCCGKNMKGAAGCSQNREGKVVWYKQ